MQTELNGFRYHKGKDDEMNALVRQIQSYPEVEGVCLVACVEPHTFEADSWTLIEFV